MAGFDSVLGMVLPDRHKKRFKTIFNLLGKARNHEQLRQDLERVDDPLVRRLHAHVKHVANFVESPPHRRNMLKGAELALWIMSFDTAYRDQGVHLIQLVLTDPGLRRWIRNSEIIGSNEWYINAVQDPDVAEDLELTLEDAREVLESS